MKSAGWALGWAVAWVLLTAGLVALWWPLWASFCHDCVPDGIPSYGDSRQYINWPPTLFAAGVVAAIVVVLASVAVDRALRHRPDSVEIHWSGVGVTTMLMAIAVTVSWFAFGRGDSYGLGPDDMLTQRRLWIYGSQFLLIGVGLYALAGTWFRRWSAATLLVSVGLAWLLQGVLLTVLGERFVANELDPPVAWYFWLVATAGPLQPAAAFIGGWLGLRLRTRPASVAS